MTSQNSILKWQNNVNESAKWQGKDESSSGGDFDNRGKLVWYPVWWARGSGGALKAPPKGPGPEKNGYF